MRNARVQVVIAYGAVSALNFLPAVGFLRAAPVAAVAAADGHGAGRAQWQQRPTGRRQRSAAGTAATGRGGKEE